LKTFFQREFTKDGGKVLSETVYKMGDRDFTPQLSRIKALKPDIIYAPIYYTECALMAKQAREMGLNVPILAGDGVQAPELIKLGGKAVEGLYLTAHFHVDTINTPLGKKFVQLFKKEVGKELDSYTAQSADAYFVIIDAIKRCGSTDPVKIRDAISSTKNFEGLTGKITIQPDGNAIKPMVVNKVKDGKFVYVTTIMP
ncbi:MAG: ABC transporter substrate-binding protein, partial [Desulfomonilaceae bacterium]